jgi:hypothetical protein
MFFIVAFSMYENNIPRDEYLIKLYISTFVYIPIILREIKCCKMHINFPLTKFRCYIRARTPKEKIMVQKSDFLDLVPGTSAQKSSLT